MALTACGGGSGESIAALESADLDQTALFSRTQSAPERDMLVVGANRAGNTVFFESANLVYPDRMNGSSLAGTIRYSSTNSEFDYEVDLDGGGTAFLRGGATGTRFVSVFSNGSRSGVAGDPTGSLPGGVATYTGNGNVLVNDGASIKEINGLATIDVSFGASDVDLTIEESGAGALAIENATISGTRFSGGSLTLTGNFQNRPVGAAVAHNGAFFGPGAEETGGAFVLNDTGATPIQIQGVYTGMR